MRVIADENMPALSLWRNAGHEVNTLPGRSISRESLTGADILLVRSVTRVNAELVAETPVRFVGSATSGIDHVDTGDLEALGIGFAHAPGANARSVVDYVLSSLAVLCLQNRFDWLNASIGIAGCGQTGSRLFKVLRACGVNVIWYDPFLNNDSELRGNGSAFDEVLACDVISVHVPLTHDGPYPTFHMFNEEVLGRLGAHQVLVNTARGEVVDSQALLKLKSVNSGPQLVLDVWENEPGYSAELARYCILATPHIAGYSHDGKVRGTAMLLQAYSGNTLECIAEPEEIFPALTTDGKTGSDCEVISSLMLDAYDVRQDAGRFLDCHESGSGPACFDRQRKRYPIRHEYTAYGVKHNDSLPQLDRLIEALGFRLR